MTQKQEKFLEFYKMTGDATEAAIRAGYSKKGAAAAGRRNLEMLDQYDDERAGKTEEDLLMDMRSINKFWSRLASGEEKEEKAVYNSDTKKAEILYVNSPLKDRLKASELRAKALSAPPEAEDAKRESAWFK